MGRRVMLSISNVNSIFSQLRNNLIMINISKVVLLLFDFLNNLFGDLRRSKCKLFSNTFFNPFHLAQLRDSYPEIFV